MIIYIGFTFKKLFISLLNYSIYLIIIEEQLLRYNYQSIIRKLLTNLNIKPKEFPQGLNIQLENDNLSNEVYKLDKLCKSYREET